MLVFQHEYSVAIDICQVLAILAEEYHMQAAEYL